jgi:hypothetical protein
MSGQGKVFWCLLLHRPEYYRSKYANMEDDAESDTQDLRSQRKSKTANMLMGDSSDSESEEDDDNCSADEAEAKKRPDESVEDWTLRVADIYKAKIETKSSASVVQNRTPDVPGGPSTSLKNDRPVVIPSNRPSRESLLSSISSPDQVERILIVEAELAERRAELAGETLLEQKERIETLITLEMERVATRNKRVPPPPRDKEARAEWFEKWRGHSLEDMNPEQVKEFKKREYMRQKERAKEKLLNKNMTEEVSW